MYICIIVLQKYIISHVKVLKIKEMKTNVIMFYIYAISTLGAVNVCIRKLQSLIALWVFYFMELYACRYLNQDIFLFLVAHVQFSKI